MKLLKFALLFVCVTGFAQTKVGTVDIEYILSQMPELATVQKQTDEYRKGLQADLETQVTAYDKELQVYKENQVTLTVAQKQQAQASLIEKEQDIAKFQQNGNQLVLLKQEEFLKPLYTKIGVSLEKLSKAGGYTQVLRRNDDIVYVDNNFDLTLAILKDMGIEVKEGE